MKEQIDYSSQIGTLINLQKIDTQIYALCREKEEIPRMFEKLKEIAEEEKLKIKDAEDDLKALQVKRKDKEIDLASKEENIKKLQTQLFQIKTNKEYTAMQKEIEGLKADNSVLEEEILLMMEEQDKAKKEIDDVKQGVTEKEKELKVKGEEVKLKLADIEKNLTQLNAQRETMTPGIEKSILAKYERVLKNKDGLALVSAEGHACQGCHMNLPPQVINEIKLRNSIIICENCTRILYLEKDDTEQPASS